MNVYFAIQVPIEQINFFLTLIFLQELVDSKEITTIEYLTMILQKFSSFEYLNNSK